jgi:hypothetical protein
MEKHPNNNKVGFCEMNIRFGSRGVQIDENEVPQALDDMPLQLLENPVAL